jgi:hypothetical protein
MSLNPIPEKDDHDSTAKPDPAFLRKNLHVPSFQKGMTALVEDYKMLPIHYPIAPN